jgi:hypothetical protein
MIIENGAGDSKKLKINGRNEATVFAVIESEEQAANEIGDAYNINSGEITLTTSTSSGLLYFKNDEDTDIIIESIAFGCKETTCTDTNLPIYVIRNPTAGTLISDAEAVSINANRNFGSSKTLKSTSSAYKAAAQSETITGGDDILLIYAGKDNRLFAPINLELPRGSSVAVRVDTVNALATICYTALIVHAKDSER